MNLSFLNPWLWLGALAAGAPLWLHLRRKSESRVHRFSALRFLDDSPHPRQGPRRLQDFWLFLLRVLAVVLLAGAFSWPYIREPERMVIQESRVYILDNTLSHQAGGGFLRDRDRIAAEVAKTGLDSQSAVIELTSLPKVVVAFGEDPDAARQKIQALAPAFQRGSYLSAFRQASTLLANSLGNRKKIVFCGDSQENQWNEHTGSPPFLDNVEVALPKLAATNAPNLYLGEPRLQRIFLGDKSLVNFTVKLGYAGQARTAKVTIRSGTQAITSREVPLEQTPGSLVLNTQWEADPAAWIKGEALVEGLPDALAEDNRVNFSLPPMREGRVALLAQSQFLKLALSPDIMRGQWATRPLDPGKLAEELEAGQDEEVLVVESGYLQSSDARKLVWRYLTNQRGVLLLVNRVSPVISAALRDLGFEVGAATGQQAERFKHAWFNHPIFHPFLSPDFGNLLEVKVIQYHPLQAADAMPLLFSESGRPLFFQSSQYPGRLLVAAFGFERAQTTWPTHLTFIPFLDLCLQQARPEDPSPADYEPGEIATVRLPPNSPVREAILRDGQRILARIPVARAQAQIPLPVRPGLYDLTYDDQPALEKVFNVNPPPKESLLSYLISPATFKSWQLGVKTETPKPLSAAVKMSHTAIWRQQIWWWLAVAGLGALLLESLWTAARRSAA